ncbi:MAG: phenylacetate--CoA ligase family protein [Elusimicrobia bacterium]|nr:phenylacetate--CoA ligase family protein [Elusimicrobiota bacterium]
MKDRLKRLNKLIKIVLKQNKFYIEKYKKLNLAKILPINSPEKLQKLPFTNKEEFVTDQEKHPPYGTNLTFSLDNYVHYHQTSGSLQKPLVWLNTDNAWNRIIGDWKSFFKEAGLTKRDIMFVASSYGPFIGFRSAHAAAEDTGCLVIPGTLQNSLQRIKNILKLKATVLASTPSYALKLANIARDNNLDIRNSDVRIIIQTGEVGAGVVSTKKKIEEVWGAKCFDIYGLTESGGMVGYECRMRDGFHFNEGQFIIEIIDPETGKPSSEEGEVVITNVNSIDNPVIRYRTGDMVRLQKKPCKCGIKYKKTLRGILRRKDDVITIRGVNIPLYDIENLLRSFNEIKEYEIKIYKKQELEELEFNISIEKNYKEDIKEKLKHSIKEAFNIRVNINLKGDDYFPSEKLKVKRIIDLRKQVPGNI